MKVAAALIVLFFFGPLILWFLVKLDVISFRNDPHNIRRINLYGFWRYTKTLKRRLLFKSSTISRQLLARFHIHGKPTYTVEDIHMILLTFLYKRISRKVLHFVFKAETAQIQPGQTLASFYRSRGINIEKKLNAVQKRTIAADSSGATFDVSLLFQCLCCTGSQVLSNDKDKWKEGSSDLESLITTVKNKRNLVSHEEPSYNRNELLTAAKELKKMLADIIDLTGQKYNLDSDEVDKAIDNLEDDFNKHLFGDHDFTKQASFQQDYLCQEGKEEVQRQYTKRGDTKVIPLSHLGESFEVEDVFTEMILLDESARGQNKDIRYENILLDGTSLNNSQVILIEGVAGVGKTTFVKKILNAWISQHPTSIKKLDRYDLVVHAECRHPDISSYVDILLRLMPKASKLMKIEDLKKIALSQRNLLILDGLDEINDKTSNLFKEVLQLQKDHEKVTVIVTTRPEKLEYYFKSANSLNIKTKHIQMVGIAKVQREKFLLNYYNGLKKNDPNLRDADGLKDYFSRKGHRNHEMWKLPYNLTALVLIWRYDPSGIDSVTTSAELYWKLYLLHRMKFKERLEKYKSNFILDCGHCLEEEDFSKNVEHCMEILGKEALQGLVFNNLNLVDHSYRRLREACKLNHIPQEEMTGAFLKKVFSTLLYGYYAEYSFPHKGIQEFFGALHIFREMERECDRFHTGVEENQAGAGQDQSDFIRNLLLRMHQSQTLEIKKFQNMLSILIGLIYFHERSIIDNMKMEVLELLQESGITASDDWLLILDSTKCDSYVAKFISQQPDVLNGEVKINDDTIYAYISLLETLEPPLEDPSRIELIFDVREELRFYQTRLLSLADSRQLKVKQLNVWDENFRYVIEVLQSPPQVLQPLNEVRFDFYIRNLAESEILELMDQFIQIQVDLFSPNMVEAFSFNLDPIFRTGVHDPALRQAVATALNGCSIREYTGEMIPEISRFDSLLELVVYVPDDASFGYLRDMIDDDLLESTTLIISISLSIDVQHLVPLPEGTAHQLMLPDLENEADVWKAVDIAKRLTPVTLYTEFSALYFPRCKLGVDDMHLLFNELNDVSIINKVVFPTGCCPTSPDSITSLPNGIVSVVWGYEYTMEKDSIYDMDSW